MKFIKKNWKEIFCVVLFVVVLGLVYSNYGPKEHDGAFLSKITTEHVPLEYVDDPEEFKDLSTGVTVEETIPGRSKSKVISYKKSEPVSSKSEEVPVEETKKHNPQSKVVTPGKKAVIDSNGNVVIKPEKEIGSDKITVHMTIDIMGGSASSKTPYPELPIDRSIMESTEVECYTNESVASILERVLDSKGVHYTTEELMGVYFSEINGLSEYNTSKSPIEGLDVKGGWCYYCGPYQPNIASSCITLDDSWDGKDIHWVYGGWNF